MRIKYPNHNGQAHKNKSPYLLEHNGYHLYHILQGMKFLHSGRTVYVWQLAGSTVVAAITSTTLTGCLYHGNAEKNKANMKSCPCIHHEGIGGVEVHIHLFLTLVSDWGEWHTYYTCSFTAIERALSGCVRPRACLDVSEKRNTSLILGQFKSLFIQPSALRHCTDYTNPVPARQRINFYILFGWVYGLKGYQVWKQRALEDPSLLEYYATLIIF